MKPNTTVNNRKEHYILLVVIGLTKRNQNGKFDYWCSSFYNHWWSLGVSRLANFWQSLRGINSYCKNHIGWYTHTRITMRFSFLTRIFVLVESSECQLQHWRLNHQLIPDSPITSYSANRQLFAHIFQNVTIRTNTMKKVAKIMNHTWSCLKVANPLTFKTTKGPRLVKKLVEFI